MIIKKSFLQERFCTWPRFKTETCGISEMAYLHGKGKSKIKFSQVQNELMYAFSQLHSNTAIAFIMFKFCRLNISLL